jgi:CHAT domain-containing protein
MTGSSRIAGRAAWTACMTGSTAGCPDSASAEPDPFAEFVNLVAKANDLQKCRQREDALILARSAETLAARIDAPQTLEAAKGFNLLGIIFFNAHYSSSALAAYKRALAIADRLSPDSDDLRANLHNNLGQVYGNLDVRLAQSHLEAAVSIRRRTDPDSRVLGYALDNLGIIHSGQDHLAEAEALHAEALGIFERHHGPFHTDVATALGNLSNVYQRRGNLTRAEAYRLRALDAHERVEGPASPEALLDIANLVDLYWDKRDDASADLLVNRLLSLIGDKPALQDRSLAEMLRQLARRAYGDFRLDVSERCDSRAVALLEALEGPQALETLAAVHELARVHHALNRRDTAERGYHRARSGYEALQRHEEVTAVTIDLAKLYREAGNYPLAEQLFRSAATALRGVRQPDCQAIASALGNLALVQYEAERYEQADATFAEALAQLEHDTTTKFSERPWLMSRRAMLKYHLGDYGAARALYDEAKRLWTEERGADHPFVATMAADLALLHWAIRDSDRALAYFAEAEGLRDRDMRILAVGSEGNRAAYARDVQSNLYKVVSFCLASNPRSPAVARFAAQMLLRRKGRVLDAIAHTFTQTRAGLDPKDLALFDRLRRVRQEIAQLMGPALVTRRPTEERARLGELRGQEERLEAELGYRGALHRPGLETVTLEEVQQGLPANGAVIELLRYDVFDPVRTGKKNPWKGSHYAAMVLRSSGDPRWFGLGPAATIDVQLDAWRSLLRRRDSPEHDRNAQGAGLYRLLVEPLRDAIAGARHLLVSPDGRLALIPFGLLGGAAGQALLDQYIVSYLASAREAVRMSAADPRSQGAVVMAAPDFDWEAASAPSAATVQFADRGDFAPLPETQQEGEEIRALLADVRLLTGRDATVEALRNVHRPVVLHVATHGIFSPLRIEETSDRLDFLTVDEGVVLVQSMAKTALANPMFFSALVLAGANHQATRPGVGVLTAQEIAGLDLRGTELVVLSACETGLGTVKDGEEFTGLRRALAIAGAATQVTSLWRVDDVATRVLMGRYYQLLLDGRGRAEAMQIAQASVARDPAHPEWCHPFYWAAFISAGAHGPMKERLTPAVPPH